MLKFSVSIIVVCDFVMVVVLDPRSVLVERLYIQNYTLHSSVTEE
jgi:hypothetical protein